MKYLNLIIIGLCCFAYTASITAQTVSVSPKYLPNKTYEFLRTMTKSKAPDVIAHTPCYLKVFERNNMLVGQFRYGKTEFPGIDATSIKEAQPFIDLSQKIVFEFRIVPETGEFDSLLNYPELRRNIDSLFELFEKKSPSKDKSVADSIKRIMEPSFSKEFLVPMYCKELGLLNGMLIEGLSVDSVLYVDYEIPNPFTGGAILTTAEISVTDNSNDSFTANLGAFIQDSDLYNYVHSLFPNTKLSDFEGSNISQSITVKFDKVLNNFIEIVSEKSIIIGETTSSEKLSVKLVKVY